MKMREPSGRWKDEVVSMEPSEASPTRIAPSSDLPSLATTSFLYTPATGSV